MSSSSSNSFEGFCGELSTIFSSELLAGLNTESFSVHEEEYIFANLRLICLQLSLLAQSYDFSMKMDFAFFFV